MDNESDLSHARGDGYAYIRPTAIRGVVMLHIDFEGRCVKFTASPGVLRDVMASIEEACVEADAMMPNVSR